MACAWAFLPGALHLDRLQWISYDKAAVTLFVVSLPLVSELRMKAEDSVSFQLATVREYWWAILLAAVFLWFVWHMNPTGFYGYGEELSVSLPVAISLDVGTLNMYCRWRRWFVANIGVVSVGLKSACSTWTYGNFGLKPVLLRNSRSKVLEHVCG